MNIMKHDIGHKIVENHVNTNMSSEDPSVISVNISDIILTPLTCATLVNEILKGLLYQKCQIPYPYNWMKAIIHKKREAPESGEKKHINFTVSNHFRVVSRAYDILENAMKAIIEEFNRTHEPIEDVIIVFGITPQTPKEVFTIKFVNLVEGHIETNHIPYFLKSQQKILRNIFLTQSLFNTIDTSIGCMNTFIFLKKCKIDNTSYCSANDSFIPTKPLAFHPKVKHTKINLCSDKIVDVNCCNFTIFADGIDNQENMKISQPSGTEKLEKGIVWYQFKDFLKGFKDCYVNKVPASELW